MACAESVAKSIKALNHKAHKGKEKLFFVLFVRFVVPFFSGPFALRCPLLRESDIQQCELFLLPAI